MNTLTLAVYVAALILALFVFAAITFHNIEIGASA